MPEAPDLSHAASPGKPKHRGNLDGLGIIIASLIGLLALLVSGYTAYIQRQQVRAEVWPYLLVGSYLPGQAIGVHNKGVGPAIVRSVQVWVDGKSQRSWEGVLGALGLPADGLTVSTIHGTVISPGERVLAVSFADKGRYERFLGVARSRVNLEICYCSSLGDCWLDSDRRGKSGTQPVGQCPAVPEASQFLD